MTRAGVELVSSEWPHPGSCCQSLLDIDFQEVVCESRLSIALLPALTIIKQAYIYARQLELLGKYRFGHHVRIRVSEKRIYRLQ